MFPVPYARRLAGVAALRRAVGTDPVRVEPGRRVAAGARAADPVGRGPAAPSRPAGRRRRPAGHQDRAGQGVGECRGGGGESAGRDPADRAPGRGPRSRVERIVRGIRRVRAARSDHVRHIRARVARHPNDRDAEEPASGRDPSIADPHTVHVDRDRRRPGRRRRPTGSRGPPVQSHRRVADRQRQGPAMVIDRCRDAQTHRKH